jgi:hypothetical protein
MKRETLERCAAAAGNFAGAICALGSETSEQRWQLRERVPLPENFVEFEGDIGGMKAFYVALAKFAIEILGKSA